MNLGDGGIGALLVREYNHAHRSRNSRRNGCLPVAFSFLALALPLHLQLQAEPVIIQTPFGPIPNPRLNQGNPNVPQDQQNAPLSAPGAAAPFGGLIPFGQAVAPANPFENPTASSPGSSAIAPIATPPLVPNQQPPARQ
jgi:hypothetical protein